MMNFCWGMKFFLDNILGYENKGWILARKSNKEKSSKVSRFDILIAGWLIPLKGKNFIKCICHITDHQIVSQMQYHNADFQSKIPCHKIKFHLKINQISFIWHRRLNVSGISIFS